LSRKWADPRETNALVKRPDDYAFRPVGNPKHNAPPEIATPARVLFYNQQGITVQGVSHVFCGYVEIFSPTFNGNETIPPVGNAQGPKPRTEARSAGVSLPPPHVNPTFPTQGHHCLPEQWVVLRRVYCGSQLR